MLNIIKDNILEFKVTENLAHSQIVIASQNIYSITIHIVLLATSGV